MRRHLFEDEHELFRESIRKFVEKEMAPHNLEWEEAGIMPRNFSGQG